MPHIVVHLSGQPDPAISRRVVESVAGLTQSVLGKKLPVIAITLQYIPHEQWFIGGQALSELGRNAFHRTSASPTRPTPRRRRRATSRISTMPSGASWASCTSARMYT